MKDSKSKIPKLGNKGAILPRKQKNERRRAKCTDSAYEKAFNTFVAMNNYNKAVAMDILEGYRASDDEGYKDNVLHYWIGLRKIKERMARLLFNIGYNKFQRALLGSQKMKPGGRKPNWVSEDVVFRVQMRFNKAVFTF